MNKRRYLGWCRTFKARWAIHIGLESPYESCMRPASGREVRAPFVFFLFRLAASEATFVFVVSPRRGQAIPEIALTASSPSNLSILGKFFRVVDDEHIDVLPRGLELETGLFLERCEQPRAAKRHKRLIAIRRVLHREIEFALQSGSIEHGALQYRRENIHHLAFKRITRSPFG